jgi:hypothetical protein
LCKIIPERGTCFCALGVAVEVYWDHNPEDLEFEINKEDVGSYSYRIYCWDHGRSSYHLPLNVAQWYGIGISGELNDNGSISRLNDDGMSFQDIAGIIRKAFLKVEN